MTKCLVKIDKVTINGTVSISDTVCTNDKVSINGKTSNQHGKVYGQDLQSNQ